MENKICKLFGIQYPIVQGGMVWISGARLAAAVSEAGGLGLIGSGSMPADVLREHIRKAKSLTDKPFGVNVPMLYSKVDQTIQVMEEEGVKIIFTSAGNPAAFTPALKEKGFTVVHVVSSVKFALKAQAAGVDAVVAEGFEAGGHNGREETATMALTPAVVRAVDIPVISAGGIASGEAMAAAMALGADGVQIASRFVATDECDADEKYKQAYIDAKAEDVEIVMSPVGMPGRALKNAFVKLIEKKPLPVSRCFNCLEKCNPAKVPYCITKALINAVRGDIEHGLIFVGANVGRITKIVSVHDLMAELVGE